MDPNSPDRNFEVAGDHQTDEGPLDLNLVTSGNKGVVHEEGKMGTLNSEEDSSPAKADIYHDENERGASFDKLPSSAENENFHIEVEDADSALSLQESFFGVNVNSEHCQGGLEKENYTQKSHELPFIDEPAEVHTGDLSGSRQFEGQDFYHENGDERNDDNHTEKNEDFYSGKQQRNNEENGPGDSDLYYRQGFQKRLASPVAKERSVTPEMASQVKVSRLEEMSSDVNHTIRSPYSDISPRRECSPSPRSPDGGHRRSPSQDRASPLKRRKSSPARIPLRDSDQRIYSPRRSFSPERTPRRDSGNPVNSPSKRLSISPSRQDSPQKHDSPQKLDSVRWQGSPQRNGSPKRQDSPRRQDLPRRGDSPRKRGSPQKRDSPQRQDSPERRDSPGNNSPRKRLSASPRRRDSSQRRGRSISQSPPGRRDSSGYKRNRHDKSRSRSPYGQDLHRRSPRRRHSPRRRSPYSGHSRRHSPRRRPWSPPSNRSTGIGRPGKNLFVAGFSFVTTERDLERKFSRYGHVTDVRIVRDKRSGDSRGFGFLSLERDEEADAAIRALDQTEWNGRIVLVEKAKTSVR